jgi:hypothetical protein
VLISVLSLFQKHLRVRGAIVNKLFRAVYLLGALITYASPVLSAGDVARAHTPLTLRLENGTHVAIHESALLDYSGMYLQQGRWGMMHARLAPGADGVAVHKTGAFTTPWRTVQIADTAAGLVNYDLVLNLNEPNRLGDVTWVKPGKYIGVWWGMHIGRHTWGSGVKHDAVNHHTRVLKAAAQRGISINTHEPVKDTGLRRTCPNWLSREGARGQEYNASQRRGPHGNAGVHSHALGPHGFHAGHFRPDAQWTRRGKPGADHVGGATGGLRGVIQPGADGG